MRERDKESQIKDWVLSRCLEVFGFTPPKNQITLLEWSGVTDGEVYIPDYVMFAVGSHKYKAGAQYFIRYDAYAEEWK